VPEAHTDFIFAIFAEEWGLVGVVLIVLLFGLFLARSVYVSLRAPDLFGRLLGMGIAILVSMQAAFNMGVVTGLLPTKGLTLPLISYGGSSLVFTLVMLGILLNVTAQARDEVLAAAGGAGPFGRVGRRRGRSEASWV